VGRQGRIALVALWIAGVTGCSLEKGGKGDTCTRSAQCATGLACIRPDGDGMTKEGKCSSDLSSLYDPDQIPMLMPDTGVPEVDAGMDAAVTAADDDAGS
jgi:hypothetical protein